MEDETIEELAYVSKEPNVEALNKIYKEDRDDHSGYADQLADSYNQRRCIWPGQSLDQKKNYADAKPWPGASDVVVPVIDPRINTLVAFMMNAIRDGNITAYPVNSDDVERAAATSTFCRWMVDSWIPCAYEHVEMSLNNMLEKGIAATWVGWEKRRRVHLEELDIEAIAQESPEFADLLADETREDEVIALLQDQFEAVNEKRARKALKELRQKGVAEIPVVKGDIDRPVIEAKCPRADIIFPSYTMDPKDVDRCHVRHFMTIQDLRSAVATEGWDEDWVNDIIEHHMGMTQSEIEGPYGNRNEFLSNQQATLFSTGNQDAEDLVEVVRTFQRLVDKEDGAVGYYHTVWCPKQVSDNRTGDKAGYAIFELLNGWDEFPIAITTLTKDSKRMYDQRNVSDLLRGNQRLAKVTRDAFVDQMSLHLNPPRTHPAGRPPSVWGAGADFATRRGEENLYKTLDIPNTMRDGVDFEQYLDAEADEIMGLRENSPNALQRQQYFVNRALSHVAEIVRLAYKAYQKFYGEDLIHFRVTGVPDPQTFNRGPQDEELDIKFFYDVRLQDREYIEKTTTSMLSLSQADVNGDIDRSELLRVVAYLNMPQFANRILRPQSEARADVIRKVADDLALISSGQSVGAQPSGAQVALQYIQEYVSQPDVAARLAQDEAFAQRIDLYVSQYEFQLQQQANAVTGRIGTEPAQLQGINT